MQVRLQQTFSEDSGLQNERSSVFGQATTRGKYE